MTDEMTARPWPDEAERFLEKIRDGATMAAARRAMRLDAAVVRNWRALPAYESALISARDEGSDSLADSLLTIFDNTPDRVDVERARAQSDNIKWLLSKRHAQKYGDRLEVSVNATIDIGSALADARARIARPVSDPAALPDPQVIDGEALIVHSPPDTVSDDKPKRPPAPAIPDVFS